jgi:hypothetical protein
VLLVLLVSWVPVLQSSVPVLQSLLWLMLSRASQASCAASSSYPPSVLHLLAQYGRLGVSLPFLLCGVSSDSLD